MSNWFSRGVDYIRHGDGSHWYSQLTKGQTTYLNGKDPLDISLENPVVAACSQIRANLLSKVEFYQEINGERVTDTEWVNLLNSPNKLQSKQDFLIQYEWYRLAYGWVYQKPYAPIGMTPTAIYNLNPRYIEFPNKLQSGLLFTTEDETKFFEQKFKYEVTEQEPKNIELNDVMMFFDIANGLNNEKTSIVTSPSRLKSVIKSVSNVDLGLDAENVIIQTNGREMFTQGNKGGNLGVSQPMDKGDREDIQKKLNTTYRVANGSTRSMVLNKDTDWTNISMKLNDLGFVESGANNANYICGMYEVPNELYKAFMKGATFENQKEAVIGMYERTIQPVADDLASTWSNHFELENPIKASFDHLPVMQHTEQKKADKLLKIAMAYEKLTRSGLGTDSIEELFRGQGIELNQEV